MAEEIIQKIINIQKYYPELITKEYSLDDKLDYLLFEYNVLLEKIDNRIENTNFDAIKNILSNSNDNILINVKTLQYLSDDKIKYNYRLHKLKLDPICYDKLKSIIF